MAAKGLDKNADNKYNKIWHTLTNFIFRYWRMYFTDIFQALSIWEGGKLKTTITPKDVNKKEQQVVREVVAGEIIQVNYAKSLLHII